MMTSFAGESSLAFALMFLLGGFLADTAVLVSRIWHDEKKGVWRSYLRGTDLIPMPNIIKPVLLLYGKREAILELACAALSVKFLADYGFSSDLGLMLFLMWAFTVALFSDLCWREIPHELNYIVMGAAVLLALLGKISWISLLFGTMPAIILTVTAILLFMLRPKNGFGIGGGDLRFVLSTGMLMGAGFAGAMVFLGSLVVVVGGFGMLVRDLRNGTATAVPMMVGFAAAYVVMLFDSYLDTPLTGFISRFIL